MPKYRLSPGATGIEMQDGSHLRGNGRASRGMYVETDNAAHSKAIDRATKEGHLLRIPFSSPAGIDETRCEPCRFNGFSWQTVCPRCGGPMRQSTRRSE